MAESLIVVLAAQLFPGAVLDSVDAALHVEDDLGRLGEDHVPELLKGPAVCRVPQKVSAKGVGEDRQEVRFDLAVSHPCAAGLHVLEHRVLKVRDALLDAEDVLDDPGVDGLHLTPEGLEMDFSPMVNVPYDASPRVEAVEHIRALEQ